MLPLVYQVVLINGR
uniref:Uncharacterized protein n=1 Tax=Anguilla anguilla TaxID=7936 RepID=A0A0E9X9Z0_ANGAN